MSVALLIDTASEQPQALVARRDDGQDNRHPFWVTAHERGHTTPLIWRFKTAEGASNFMHAQILAKPEWRARLTSVSLELVTFSYFQGQHIMAVKRHVSCLNFWTAYFLEVVK